MYLQENDYAICRALLQSLLNEHSLSEIFTILINLTAIDIPSTKFILDFNNNVIIAFCAKRCRLQEASFVDAAKLISNLSVHYPEEVTLCLFLLLRYPQSFSMSVYVRMLEAKFLLLDIAHVTLFYMPIV